MAYVWYLTDKNEIPPVDWLLCGRLNINVPEPIVKDPDKRYPH